MSVWRCAGSALPVLSPDGRLAVVSVAEPAYDPKDQVSDLWLLHPGTELTARRLTFTKGTESGATFRPGRQAPRLRRLSVKEILEDQIYVLDLFNGGEAQRITDVPMGARSPRFSPDGTQIAYVTDVWPGAPDDAI
jgi:Tol biopolymer transport system component